jgi:hypothetical protein
MYVCVKYKGKARVGAGGEAAGWSRAGGEREGERERERERENRFIIIGHPDFFHESDSLPVLPSPPIDWDIFVLEYLADRLRI